jgi:hypothetical protein
VNRGASAAVQAEWAKAANAPAHLLEVRFDAGDGGSVYLTDSYRSVIWGGNTYVGVGQLLGFSGLTESLELRVADITVELSGVDQSFIATFLQRKYIDRRLLINKAFFDATDTLVIDPFAIHDGRMDEPRIVEDPEAGKCVVQVASRDQFADFEKLSGRHTNPHDQNIFFPMDRGFDKLAQLNSTPFVWGHIKEPPATGLGAAATRLIYSRNNPDLASHLFGSG